MQGGDAAAADASIDAAADAVVVMNPAPTCMCTIMLVNLRLQKQGPDDVGLTPGGHLRHSLGSSPNASGALSII